MPELKKRVDRTSFKGKRKRIVESEENNNSSRTSESNKKRVRWEGNLSDSETNEQEEDEEEDESVPEKVSPYDARSLVIGLNRLEDLHGYVKSIVRCTYALCTLLKLLSVDELEEHTSTL